MFSAAELLESSNISNQCSSGALVQLELGYIDRLTPLQAFKIWYTRCAWVFAGERHSVRSQKAGRAVDTKRGGFVIH